MNVQRIQKKDRFDLSGGLTTMKAVVTTGNGGYEKLAYRDVPVPAIAPGEVLLQVLAAGVNNTEINTRLGWYSSEVTTGTEALSAGEKEKAKAKADGGWNEATPFPFIQGTDCCGRVVAVAPGGDERTMGLRVLVRPCIRSSGWKSLENIWMASDFDGAFAQFVKVGAGEVFPVDCDWSDAELGTIPCAYGTAENMVHRANVSRGEQVLTFDMRDFYLKDLMMIGCTAWDKSVFPNIVSYIESGEIRPLLAKTFPLERIVEAQRAFTEKKHVGKFVLIPPTVR